MSTQNEPFYLRYYSGHSGRFGHEFLGWLALILSGSLAFAYWELEFDFRTLGDGRSAAVRYANTQTTAMTRSSAKRVRSSSRFRSRQIKRIIKESEIMKEDDSKWPQKNKDGRQELEIRLGNEHISFEVLWTILTVLPIWMSGSNSWPVADRENRLIG
ncbi:mago nashi protein [Aspergillus terreus NIH2624]|uniref:Mago nashi protein n=1 Tax=Aspergillus terreus (strain NIH 2624 / FGSC A1156) TaxID=341663 RepID=Q0D192_ASPTN|nr:mago nashi protein [Aspergillus terreus NIH2624]EAU38938.1 mago nashi protein [Aspergillus terreus NIH2624]